MFELGEGDVLQRAQRQLWGSPYRRTSNPASAHTPPRTPRTPLSNVVAAMDSSDDMLPPSGHGDDSSGSALGFGSGTQAHPPAVTVVDPEEEERERRAATAAAAGVGGGIRSWFKWRP